MAADGILQAASLSGKPTNYTLLTAGLSLTILTYVAVTSSHSPPTNDLFVQAVICLTSKLKAITTGLAAELMH